MNTPELIAPANGWDCLRAAVANGADAVYFGLPRFNARMRAGQFTTEELKDVVQFLHDRHARAFVTLNTLVFTDELAEAESMLIRIDEAGADAVIVQDLGVAVLARELGLRPAIFGSTQMTVTSPEGARWAARLGIRQVVLARELSLGQMRKLKGEGLPSLEVFIHGALCISFSGQCLASLAIGERSGNRGECAQPCRLPYELVVDGAAKDMGDRRYLLSPQDLTALKEIPELIRLGVAGFKIEGRMKSAEYVAGTTRLYRKAIDAAIAGKPYDPASPDDRYELEMAFSRGLCAGWLHGPNPRELVHGRFGKRRGAQVGQVSSVGRDHAEVTFAAGAEARLRPGDGLVFECGDDPEQEEGGRLYERKERRLFFGNDRINFTRIKPGDRVWKTSDPCLERAWRKTCEGEIPVPKIPIDLRVKGCAGHPLVVETTLGEKTFQVSSLKKLETARKQPLTTEMLREQLGRLGNTPFELREIHNELAGEVILPVSQLNALRRELAAKIPVRAEKVTVSTSLKPVLADRMAAIRLNREGEDACVGARRWRARESTCNPDRTTGTPAACPYGGDSQTSLVEWSVLCRTTEQLGASIAAGCRTVYADLDDPSLCSDAVRQVRQSPGIRILLATPRIQMPGEEKVFREIDSARPDGVLIRNLGALEYFRKSPLEKVGDFSLNVTNPLAARLLIDEGLARVTLALDLSPDQALALLRAARPAWFEMIVHQHLPMFHTAHCLFAANLSKSADPANCGRPCQRQAIRLRDRKGVEHPVRRDAFCRTTVFQSSLRKSEALETWRAAGLRHFRIELLEETGRETEKVIAGWRDPG